MLNTAGRKFMLSAPGDLGIKTLCYASLWYFLSYESIPHSSGGLDGVFTTGNAVSL